MTPPAWLLAVWVCLLPLMLAVRGWYLLWEAVFIVSRGITTGVWSRQLWPHGPPDV